MDEGHALAGTTTRELIQLGPRHAFNNHAGGCTIL